MAFNRYSGHKKSNPMTTEFQQLGFPFVCCHVLVMVSVGHGGLYRQITGSQLLLSIFIQKNHLKNIIRMMCMLTNLAIYIDTPISQECLMRKRFCHLWLLSEIVRKLPKIGHKLCQNN